MRNSEKKLFWNVYKILKIYHSTYNKKIIIIEVENISQKIQNFP